VVVDNYATSEPPARKLRRGGAGSSTMADYLDVLDAAIAVLPAPCWRRLMANIASG
jgi:hypothetical protein